MKLTFFSNYLNHHQLPFCFEMVKLLGDGFRFVASTPFNQTRSQLGYADMNMAYDFVVRSYEDKTQYAIAMELAVSSDVMIFGSTPEVFFYQRILKNPKGLTLRYSERLYKDFEGRINYRNVFFYWSFLINRLTSRKNLLLLAASAYAPYDYVRSGFCKERIYKWGYFPDSSCYPVGRLMEKKIGRIRLIWVGRLIDWKHPAHAIEVAHLLQKEQIDFELEMIGTGPMLDDILNLVKEYQLQENVICTGGLPADKVREEMEKSHIHLFTSDYNEGWGAVLNESMASACVPVCSVAVGAAPFLIEHGKNGFVYNVNDISGMYCYVKRLAEDPVLLRNAQINAYQQIRNHWNAQIAAKNLMALCESFLSGEENKTVSYGPCSRAEYIKQNDMYEYMLTRKENGIIE